MARDSHKSSSSSGVVGAGLMGSGIAAIMCAAGMPVQVFDTDAARLAKVPAKIEDILKDLEEYRLAEAGSALLVKERLKLVSDIREFEACGLLVEAIVEDEQIKRELYTALESVLRPDAIIASNTSNIIPSVLVQGMRHPERFIVAHFWNPPYAVPLVEIVPAPQTNVQTIEQAVEWVKRIGNEPVLLKKEVAGFIGNRLQYALLREALWLVSQGVASAEEIDNVMTLSLGRRYAVTGPFATADLGGLDTFLTISRQLMPQLASNLLPLQIMEEAVARGHVGMKSGRGLLEWSAARSAAVLQRRKQELLRRRHRETVKDESLLVIS